MKESIRQNHLAEDKWFHRGFSGFISMAVTGVMTTFGVNVLLSCIVGFFAAFLCGVGKEVYDASQEGGKWDWYDLLADVEGAVLGTILGVLTGTH
jgi:uncharacterized protein YfiM (DUF2279 family)